jgi:signal transduction histidine kinase
MPHADNALRSERILIHAPYGRDAALIQGELSAAGFFSLVCTSMEDLCECLHEGAGAALVGDEALSPEAIETLAGKLSNQPPWSNFPLLVMTSGGAATRGSRYRLQIQEPLGNVTLIERPVRPVTLVSSVRSALRARRHQYQLCDLLAELAESNRGFKCANEELRRVNGELEEFAYVASHDLQEPLRMVNIYTHLILKAVEENVPENLGQYREFVRVGIDRMESLIRDLLTFSRTIQIEPSQIEAGRLSDSWREAVSVMHDRIEESGAAITTTPLPTVCADAAQMAHVFQNLLSNSIKYRRKDVALAIDVSAKEVEGNWIVAFRDNGIGFDQQYAERIFGLFKRLHKDEYPGTGLGLAICKRIVERYGGRIWATSAAGQGAAVYFSLPGGGVGQS